MLWGTLRTGKVIFSAESQSFIFFTATIICPFLRPILKLTTRKFPGSGSLLKAPTPQVRISFQLRLWAT